ncbi:MAG: Gfo/Idh/MocA family oxidoreductase [Armatimonadetes bacterium]|nr:Gfo/Idh/MocA family oxidoreductase [Armatimonadota bacterium]
MSLRVAVVGVRGVGKFHAQWYAKEGCEIVAFVSSRPETLPQNEKAIRSVAPNFQGQGYTSLRDMLDREKPDAVSVCSPHHLHAEHCLEALSRGIHVLCEKPLVWFGPGRLDEALEQARKIVNLAAERNLQFAVNTQYVAAIPHLLQIWDKQGLPKIPEQLTLVMEAKMKERDTSGVNLWIDLAPHPLSILLALFPEAELDLDSVVFEGGTDSLGAHFSIHHQSRQIPVTIRVRRHDGELERSVTWNGFKVKFLPWVGEDGVYRIQLVWANGAQVVKDFMQVSIQRFVQSVLGEGTPLCDATVALRQMEWLIALTRKYLTARW